MLGTTCVVPNAHDRLISGDHEMPWRYRPHHFMARAIAGFVDVDGSGFLRMRNTQRLRSKQVARPSIEPYSAYLGI